VGRRQRERPAHVLINLCTWIGCRSEAGSSQPFHVYCRAVVSDQWHRELLNHGLGFRPHAAPPGKGLCSLLGQHAHAIGQLGHTCALGQAQKRGEPFAVGQFIGQRAPGKDRHRHRAESALILISLTQMPMQRATAYVTKNRRSGSFGPLCAKPLVTSSGFCRTPAQGRDSSR